MLNRTYNYTISLGLIRTFIQLAIIVQCLFNFQAITLVLVWHRVHGWCTHFSRLVMIVWLVCEEIWKVNTCIFMFNGKRVVLTPFYPRVKFENQKNGLLSNKKKARIHFTLWARVSFLGRFWVYVRITSDRPRKAIDLLVPYQAGLAHS